MMSGCAPVLACRPGDANPVDNGARALGYRTVVAGDQEEGWWAVGEATEELLAATADARGVAGDVAAGAGACFAGRGGVAVTWRAS